MRISPTEPHPDPPNPLPTGSAQRPPVRLGLSRSAFTSFSPATPSVTSPGPSYHKKPAPPATVAPTRPIPFAPAAAAPSDRTKSASTAGASYDWLSGAASDGRHQASRTELSKLGPSASTASFAVAPAPHAGLHQLPFVPGLAANMHPHVNPEMLDRMMLALSQQHQQQVGCPACFFRSRIPWGRPSCHAHASNPLQASLHLTCLIPFVLQTSEQLSRAAAASQHRAEAVARFLKKRKERCFDKKVRYASRQRLAETRPRIRGQFVKAADLAAYRAGTLPGAPRPQAQASSEGSGGSGQAEGSC